MKEVLLLGMILKEEELLENEQSKQDALILKMFVMSRMHLLCKETHKRRLKIILLLIVVALEA